MPNCFMMSPWYGSSRIDVVGPAAVTFHFAVVVLQHHRPAVVQDAAVEIHAVRQLAAIVQILVHRIAPGEHHTGDQDLIANLQFANGLL